MLYVEGHGRHLAANLIGNNLVANTDARLALSVVLFDEPIGLPMWFARVIGLAQVAVTDVFAALDGILGLYSVCAQLEGSVPTSSP